MIAFVKYILISVCHCQLSYNGVIDSTLSRALYYCICISLVRNIKQGYAFHIFIRMLLHGT